MTMMRSVYLVKVIVGVLLLFNNVGVDSQERVYNTPELIQEAGYVAERHHVTTSDGYILEMHRIPFRKGETSGLPNRPVVFMLHGLLAASSSFIFLGPDYGIPYNLADAGYDVWMGNARGTRNSRFHVTLDPGNSEDRHEFWNFSWHEIGSIDVAAMVDYALEHTGQERLHYIGHSQGGTSFLVLGATRPEYNQKFASVHLLAGVGYMTYFPNVLLRTVAQFSKILYPLSLSIGLLEMFPPLFPRPDNEVSTNSDFDIYAYCAGDVKHRDFCELIGLREMMDERIFNITIPELPDIGVGGAAFKQMAQYGQNIQDNQFRCFDYGTVQNLLLYGRSHPPIYNLSLITADVTMHYTVSDTLLHEKDVLAMAADMPNTRARRVARDSFLHADFIFAQDVKELVTDYIIEYIADAALRPPPPPPITPPPENSSEEDNGNGTASSIVLGFVLKLYLIILSLHSITRAM